MIDDEPLLLHRLGTTLGMSFEHLGKAIEHGKVADAGLWWADFVASRLDQLMLRDPTACEPGQALFSFAQPHHIKASLFQVPGSGANGRGRVDVLFQLWLDTESAKLTLGTPLVFQIVDGGIPVPDDVWAELREMARPLSDWAPSARMVLCGHPNPFAYPPTALLKEEKLYAIPAAICAGSLTPPRGMSGHRGYTLGHDLVSGWIGDSLLGGAQNSTFQQFLCDFQVQHVLRLHISKPD